MRVIADNQKDNHDTMTFLWIIYSVVF